MSKNVPPIWMECKRRARSYWLFLLSSLPLDGSGVVSDELDLRCDGRNAFVRRCVVLAVLEMGALALSALPPTVFLQIPLGQRI